MDPIIGGGLIKLGGALIDRLFPDKTERDKAKLALVELEQQGELAQLNAEVQLLMGQIAVNKIEAAGGWFRAGWRPFVGWTCGVALAYEYIIRRFIEWGVVFWMETPVYPPELDMTQLIGVLLGMLGLAMQRGKEKMADRG